MSRPKGLKNRTKTFINEEKIKVLGSWSQADGQGIWIFSCEQIPGMSSEPANVNFCPIAPTQEHFQIKLRDDAEWWCTFCAYVGCNQSERKPWN